MSALACFAAVAVAVIVLAAGGASWLIAALDGPLWAFALVVSVGVGALLGLARGLKAPGRDPSWREREAREHGFPFDGDRDRRQP